MLKKLFLTIATIALSSCAVTPPKLPEVDAGAELKPINSSEWKKKIEESKI